jgi:hypothetical protein
MLYSYAFVAFLVFGFYSSNPPSKIPFPIESIGMNALGVSNASESDECKQPVCWTGDNDDQTCYACEYGKPSQHVVCTKKGSAGEKSYNLAVEHNNQKNECPAPSAERERYQNKGPKKDDETKPQ